VFSKYEWMVRFHNWALYHTAHILKASGTLSEDDVWSFSSLAVKHTGKATDFKSLLWTDRAFRMLSRDSKEARLQAAYTKGVNWLKEWPFYVGRDERDLEPVMTDLRAAPVQLRRRRQRK
jgi:hypothetical protein